MKDRKELIDDLTSNLRYWSRRLDDVEADAARVKEDAKDLIAESRRRATRLNDLLARTGHVAKAETADAWERTSEEVVRSWRDFRRSAERAYRAALN